MEFVKNKRGIISEYLPWIIIALAILVIMMFAIFLLKDKGVNIIDSLKGIFKGR